ncbi:MAG TPA: ABC transporter substrate-binding protein [Candidatus Faecalibacterium gallistercoris]|uniref:ABC transporter substrate-binding protein n=1 Tax=Candidatus Faecalibacterium gallistercoris TaxID=2838579 RepID=A0A9D2FHG1_9FIRM|nr:ABC transporter substrate-binding protein [Candidatus Faecalibacterium gallistercoris]
MKTSISRRQFLAVVGAVAAAGALSACGSSSSSTASSAASGAASGSASGDTIKVGLLAPLTGDVSVYGIAVANGASLYIKQINEAGGINGKQVELIQMDEQGDATQAVNCFTQMVDQGITALIGDVTTTPTLAVVAATQDYNMPMVTASATAEAVTYDAETDTVYQNVFRTTFTDPFQGVKMGDYATDKLGYTRAAVIYQIGADYNEGLATNFESEFAANGGEIVASETYSAGDVDFRTQLTTILAANPEVVYCPNYYEDVGQILSQAESVGLTVPFLGGDGWDGVTQYATAEQLDGCYFCANYATGSNPDFESAYETEYGESYPNGFAPLGYDAAMTVCYGLQAAEEAGLEAGSDEYKQAVIDGIKGGEIEGVTGTFTFDDHNDPVKTAAILSFENGEAVFVEQY